MAKAHDRILEIEVTPEPTGNTVSIDAVNYYRDRAQLDAANPLAIAFSGGSAAVTPVEVEVGETVPPPSIIRLVFPASF